MLRAVLQGTWQLSSFVLVCMCVMLYTYIIYVMLSSLFSYASALSTLCVLLCFYREGAGGATYLFQRPHRTSCGRGCGHGALAAPTIIVPAQPQLQPAAVALVVTSATTVALALAVAASVLAGAASA